LAGIHHSISEFGGDPSNITLFGELTGPTVILCHLRSSANQTRDLFHRAILQSPSIEFNVSNPQSAGAGLARTLSSYNANTAEELRKLDLERLVAAKHTLRVTNDNDNNDDNNNDNNNDGDDDFCPHWREQMFGDPQHDASIPDDPTTLTPL
jgi:carboxylesterase type B